MESEAESHTSNFNTHFCIQMANRLLLEEAEKGSNFAASPLSFHVMLSLVAVGSTGHTLEQLLSYLGSPSLDDLNLLCSHIISLAPNSGENNNLESGPLFLFINGAWVDHSFGLKPSFKGILESVYKAVDFANKAKQVEDEVNSWAENETKGLIKGLLPSGSLGTDTALVLANALYFKGAWDRKFDKTKTKVKDFHLLNGQTVQVPFMTSKDTERHMYRSHHDYKILKIPYQNSQFSMYFFLPTEKNGLQKIVDKFSSIPGFFNQQFELREDDIPDFWVPRFRFSFEFEASSTMKEMGLHLPFVGRGEFTRLVDSPKSDELCLSKIFHKAYIEVNEDGTEAAASTAATFIEWCDRGNPPSFVADHPFTFLIREEKSRIIFFIGAVLNPSSPAG